MKFIDYHPNIERAITYVEALTILKNEDIELKKISKVIKEHIENKLQIEINSNNITIYYLESIIRKARYNDLSNIKKEIIISNILLPNDEEIAVLLNQNGYTLEDLKSILRFRTILKNNILNDTQLDQNNKEKYEEYKKEITKIIKIFKSNLNIDNQTIILNRICEMLVTCPELFERKPNFKAR